MSCIKKVIPWVVDPIGMIIHDATDGGFPYTPGGMVNQVLNPPTRPQPQVQPQPKPTVQAPQVSLIYPATGGPPHPPPTVRPRIGSPSGSDTDKTAGLVSGRRGGSLLA